MSDKHHRFPEGYGNQHGVLTVSGRTVIEWIAEHGSPLFLYDTNLMRKQVTKTRAALPATVKLHYAMKANPHPAIVAFMAGETDGLDIASGGELAIALAAGVSPGKISFAGPGKTDVELRDAIVAGIKLNLESELEALRVAAMAASLGTAARVAVRVNPAFEIKGASMRMGGSAQPFGIDEERVPALLATLGEVPFVFEGFHVYAGSQSLNADQIIESQEKTLEMLVRLSAAAPCPPAVFNIGGGFGVPYFPGDMPLDIVKVGSALAEQIAQLPESLRHTEIVVELGRYLVAESGVYICNVLDKKTSYGETFLITDGGLHHQLAASGQFGQVLRRNYPIMIATNLSGKPTHKVTVTGCLCTPLDRLAYNMPLPDANPGDLVAVFLAGAYGASASPKDFLNHPYATEIII